ncbi:hypothetical protein J6590_096863, partial [Homalodisca vitripennis]
IEHCKRSHGQKGRGDGVRIDLEGGVKDKVSSSSAMFKGLQCSSERLTASLIQWTPEQRTLSITVYIRDSYACRTGCLPLAAGSGSALRKNRLNHFLTLAGFMDTCLGGDGGPDSTAGCRGFKYFSVRPLMSHFLQELCSSQCRNWCLYVEAFVTSSCHFFLLPPTFLSSENTEASRV